MVEKVIILGGGPAGLSAAIYTAREGFTPLIIAGFNAGGQLLLTTLVENIPGFPNGIMGPDYIIEMRKQAEKFGARFIDENATAVDLKSRPFKVTAEGKVYETETLVIATGANSKWLGLDSEQKFMGRGVSSCATCLPPSSLVVANASTVAIGTLQNGAKVLTHDGSFKKVMDTTQQEYTGNLVKFKTRFFRSEETLLTPNHPVLAKRIIKRGKGAKFREITWSLPFWVDAGSLQKEDFVLYPIPKEITKLNHINIAKELGMKVDNANNVRLDIETYTSHRLPNILKINKEFALLVGYYLSEGFSHERGISFAFSSKEMEYAKDCVNIIKQLFGINSTIKRESSVLRVTAHSLILSRLFQKLFGNYSHEKRLPHEFILLNKDLQKEIIKGMWRGDGCMRKEDFIITSSSRELIEQLKMILLRLDILPGVEKRKFSTLQYSVINGRKVEFKKDVYQIVIGGPWIKTMSNVVEEQHPVMAKTKWNCYNGFILDGYAHLKIRQISKEFYTGQVHNIAVDENNTYVTTNSIVHNCDGALYKNKNVVVIGGGDTAMEDSLFLTRFANSVTIIHRKDSFRASNIMSKRALKNPKIKVIWNSAIEEIKGDQKVKSVSVKNLVTNQTTEMPIDGVFVAIGHAPNTQIFKDQLPLDELGYLVTKEEVGTDIEGVFVAGDVADRRYRQAATASGSGVKAALRVREYFQNKGG